uniref:Uncharacterized protein n=2 Tax=Glossina morsitans morsitans TaxID=37546 RepID=A0A1B0GFV6_GLOMM
MEVALNLLTTYIFAIGCVVIIIIFFYPRSITRETLQNYVKTCVIEENISTKDLKLFMAWNFSNISNEGKCFFSCFHEKIGLTINGVLQKKIAFGHLKRIFDRETAEFVLGECVNLVGKDKCETAYQFEKCLFNIEYNRLAK